MTIFVSSAADLVAMINVASGLSLVEADVIFGTPRVATGAEITQYGKNTAIPVSAAPSSTKISGFTTFFYDRIPLQPLENINLNFCICPDAASVATWVPIVFGYTRIPFTVAELVDNPSFTANGKVNVKIEVGPNHLGWTGSATLKFGGYPDIATAFNGNTLQAF
ncbi:hypothetical protein D3C85_249490 [compost metagenome]